VPSMYSGVSKILKPIPENKISSLAKVGIFSILKTLRQLHLENPQHNSSRWVSRPPWPVNSFSSHSGPFNLPLR
jgi:hypothetical protein